MTTSELIGMLSEMDPNAVVYLSIPGWEFVAIEGVAHEPSQDGPGCNLLHIDPDHPLASDEE